MSSTLFVDYLATATVDQMFLFIFLAALAGSQCALVIWWWLGPREPRG